MSVEYKDYYKILGVGKEADKDEISMAYKKLARKYHPDLIQGNAQAEEKFKEVTEAYEVLKDDEKRKLYDQLGPNWRRRSREVSEVAIRSAAERRIPLTASPLTGRSSATFSKRCSAADAVAGAAVSAVIPSAAFLRNRRPGGMWRQTFRSRWKTR